jgi:hypothetical protein
MVTAKLLTVALALALSSSPQLTSSNAYRFEKCPSLTTGSAMPFRLVRDSRTHPPRKGNRSCWLGSWNARANRPSTTNRAL